MQNAKRCCTAPAPRPLRPPKMQNAKRPRSEWHAHVERDLLMLHHNFSGRFSFAAGSRRAMIWHETERRLSTDDGRPLDPAAAAAGVRYPWQQRAVLRQRLCHAVESAPGARDLKHLLRPGQADMTLKASARGAAVLWVLDRCHRCWRCCCCCCRCQPMDLQEPGPAATVPAAAAPPLLQPRLRALM